MLWDSVLGGTGNDFGTVIEETWESGFLAAGSTTSFGAGSSDIWLIKTDSAGDTLWTMTLGETSGTRDMDASDIRRSYYAVGSTRSYGSGSSDAIVCRLAPETGIGQSALPKGPSFVRVCNPAVSGNGIDAAFFLPEPSQTTFAIYDLGGRLLHTTAEGSFPEGLNHRTLIPEERLAPGCYILNMILPRESRATCFTVVY